MRILIALILTISGAVRAEDLADKACNIFLVQAHNTASPSIAPYYEGTMAISRDILGGDYQNSQVAIQFRATQTNGNWHYTLVDPVRIVIGKYQLYEFRLPFGAANRGDVFHVVPFVATSTKRLYDNNFPQGKSVAELTSANNWMYQSTTCRLQ